jgi:phosphatidylglycerophosphate synthase/choline kinase
MKAVIWATEAEKAMTRLCGIPLLQRLLYTLRTANMREVIIVVSSNSLVERETGDGGNLGICLSYCLPHQLGEHIDGAFLILEANYVLDERIIRSLAEGKEMAIAYDSRIAATQDSSHLEEMRVSSKKGKVAGLSHSKGEGAYVGASRCSPEVLPLLDNHVLVTCLAKAVRIFDFAALDVAVIQPYVAEIRRELPALWFRIESREDVEHCKRILVRGAEKRTLDVLAWYFNRPIENWITYHIADLPITPNLMSILTYLVAFLVTFLLLSGWLLAAALLAFIVNVMDGLDGKLARVKGMATKLGQLEHSLDLLYEQSWYIALAWAVYRLSSNPFPLALGFAAILFDSFARHVSMQFSQVMGVSLADYAPFDRRFRRFDGRRNIYTIYILLGALFGVPYYALVAIALHAFITGLVYLVRAARHLHNADRGFSARN